MSKMDNFSKERPQGWKIRRGVNLDPLLPPFMWLKPRPPRKPPRSSTDFLETEEKIVRDEIRLAAVQKFAPTSNILLNSRRTDDSIARSTAADSETYRDKKKISNEISDTTKDSGDFSSTRAEEFKGGSADPMVSHRLSTSYERLPPPRYYRGDEKNLEYNPIQLAKRPRSPIRDVLHTKFDLEAARKKLPTSLVKLSATDDTDNSKDQISDDMKNRLHVTPYDHGPPALPLLLKVILGEVALISACKSFGIDVQVFANVATTWALVELEAVELARAFEKKLSNSEAFPNIRRLCGRVVKSSKPMSLKARIPSARNPLASLPGSTVHQSLPWDLLCPGHEASVVDGYRNVADCIDERMPGSREDSERKAHVPDLTCYHFLQAVTTRRDEKPPRVSPQRNFGRFTNAKSDTGRIEEFLVQLVGLL